MNNRVFGLTTSGYRLFENFTRSQLLFDNTKTNSHLTCEFVPSLCHEKRVLVAVGAIGAWRSLPSQTRR